MKRFTTWLFVIVLTFALCVTATLLYLKLNYFNSQESKAVENFDVVYDENSSADLPILSYCELANNPEKYDGKIVRLSATLEMGIEGSWFDDANCEKSNDAAIVKSINEEVWDAVQRTREQKDKKVLSNEVNLIVVGRFKNSVYKDCCLITPFQFEILKVENASNPVR
ncbi:MAG: hypothetical protein ACR2N3_16910 [Pyrinomonadaceae bacterium]